MKAQAVKPNESDPGRSRKRRVTNESATIRTLSADQVASVQVGLTWF